jgi:hypothetical protein
MIEKEFHLVTLVVRGGIEPPAFRFSGAYAAWPHVAGCGLMGQLAAETMAGRRLMWPDVCLRWLPVWLLVSAASVRYVSRPADRDATQGSGQVHTPGIPTGLPSRPTAPGGPFSSPSARS